MVFQELILSSKKIDLHLPMIRDGELDNSSNSINYSSKILSGGLIKNMMVNFGILTITEQI